MSEGFKAVDWMRRRREQIDSEDRELTWQEREQKTRELLSRDPLWKKLEIRVRLDFPGTHA